MTAAPTPLLASDLATLLELLLELFLESLQQSVPGMLRVPSAMLTVVGTLNLLVSLGLS